MPPSRSGSGQQAMPTRSMQASSTQARTTELTISGPRTANHMDSAGCAVPRDRPWNSRGAQNCGSICSAPKPPAWCWQAESSDCRHMAQGKPRACVSPELTSSGEPFRFVAAARASLPARCGQAHNCNSDTLTRHGTEHSNFRNESDLLC
jgi:hypothetical protein